MNDFIFARSQMAMSLTFHIVFAAIGIGMPLLMVISEYLYLRTHNTIYLDLSKRWAKGTAVLFAIGAVSGTVLSFELGMLWPEFMRFAGAIIGMPFSLEGFAFFTEAIFLGIYLYGWDRVSPRIHWLSGIAVAFSGAISGIFVVTVNAWMNTPAGFELVNGKPSNIDPIAAMLNPAAFHETLHMTVAAYMATSFAVAGIHAFFVLRKQNKLFHQAAFRIALIIACLSVPLIGFTGDLSARQVAQLQPAKLAAMEAHYHTDTNVPLLIGGIANSDTETIAFALPISGGLSFLAFGNADAIVTGLDAFPREDWPQVPIVHLAFDMMVGIGFALASLAFWAGFIWWRKKSLPDGKWLLRAFVLAAPLGFLSIEAGWVTTELGRQPWAIYNVLRTADAVTPVTGLVIPFIVFTLLYFFLSIVLVAVLRQIFLQSASTGDSYASNI